MDFLSVLCCPLCNGQLDHSVTEFSCSHCQREYPIVLGIPDFRVFPDPYIGIEQDREKGQYVLEQAGHKSFEEMVRFYWSITPDVSPVRAERFMRRVFSLDKQWRESLPFVEQEIVKRLHFKPKSVLELGCGTGGFLAAAGKRYDRIIGIDIAFRWLVIARKRLEEQRLSVPLICACAENLPFREGVFDFILADSVLEHVSQQDDLFRECRRVICSEACLYIITPNRISLTSEPHFRVWGVGFLPRRWMDSYVRMVKGIPYRHIQLVSPFGLRRIVNRANFKKGVQILPELPSSTILYLSRIEQRYARLYNRFRTNKFLKLVYMLFGPIIHYLVQVRSNE